MQMGDNNACFEVFSMNKGKHRRRVLNLPMGHLAYGRIMEETNRSLYCKGAAQATVGTS